MQLSAELLINKRSRRGQSNKQSVLDALKRHSIRVVTLHEVSRSTPLELVLKNIQKKPPVLLIVASGDGTISTVMDALVESDIEIGLIPLGTTNNFARSLGIPFDIDGAAEHLRKSKGRSIDLGHVNSDYFTNVAGIGLSAEIAKKVTSAQKQRWGRLAYGIVGARLLIQTKPFTVTIKDPDNEFGITVITRQVIIANGRYHAGRQIADDAEIDSGELVIFPLGGKSMFSFVKHMFDFYIGGRKQISQTAYFVGRNVEINTSTMQLVELDGEVKQQTPLKVQISPGTIKVRA